MQVGKTVGLVAVLAVTASASLGAQACLGSVKRPSAKQKQFNVAGTFDIASGANTIGARAGLYENAKVFGHLGVRSTSAGGSSIISGDFELGGEIIKADDESKSLCGVVNLDAINLSDGDNGTAIVSFGVAYGKAIPQGDASIVPFGRVGVAVSSRGATPTDEGSAYGVLEGGVGYRLPTGLSLKGSLLTSTQSGSNVAVRLVVTYPFGAK